MKVFMLGTRIKDGLGYRPARPWRDSIPMACMYCQEYFTVSQGAQDRHICCTHCNRVNAVIEPTASACARCYTETTLDDTATYYDTVVFLCSPCHDIDLFFRNSKWKVA